MTPDALNRMGGLIPDGSNMPRNYIESPSTPVMFYPRRKGAGCLGLAFLAFAMAGAYIATRNGSVTMVVCSCAAFLLFVFFFEPALRNQTIEIGNDFIIVRTFRRPVKLKTEHLVEVVKRQNGSLAYRFHAGGILHYQVSPLGYYDAETLQKHFDCIFDLDRPGDRRAHDRV